MGNGKWAGPPLRVAVDPLESTGNPYASMLNGALRDLGVELEQASFKPWSLTSPPPAGPQVVHIHWPEYVLSGSGAGAKHVTRATAAALALRTGVWRLKRAGTRVVWTVHNRRPHDPAAPRAQVALYPWMARAADAVIVHSEHTAQLVRELLGVRRPVHVAHHGNYIGAYPPAGASREELRARHGFGPGDRVLLAFGEIRPYKRLAELARELAAHPDPALRLLIAGRARDAATAAELRAAAAADERVTLDDRRIPDEEVAGLYELADLAVLNYREVFSSGALLLALSLGTAVVAPREGSAGELADEPAAFLWDGSPLEVVERALAVPAARRRAAAIATAESYSWERMAREHLSAYLGAAPEAT